jgi:hypothetical protein
MLPALARTLEVAPARSTPSQLEQLCLEEHVREMADELLRESPVIASLHSRGELHIERAVCSADGALSVV